MLQSLFSAEVNVPIAFSVSNFYFSKNIFEIITLVPGALVAADAPDRAQRAQVQVPHLLEAGQARRALEDRGHRGLEAQGAGHTKSGDTSFV
jgi:hypothetical protein